MAIQHEKQVFERARGLCLFGVGALLQECYDQVVLALGREPDVLCDNAPEKWGRVYFGKRCIPPEELARSSEGMVAVVTVRQYEDIRDQLKTMGIREVYAARFDSGYHALRGLHQLDQDEPMALCEPGPVDLRGKWTLVTGASRGVGRQIALAMAELGSNIIAHSRSMAHVEEVVRACSAKGIQAVPIAAELAHPDEVEAMLTRLDNCAPQVDILFNNAAVHTPAPWSPNIWAISDRVFRDFFAVNSIAPVLLCQRLIPAMIQRGFGRIVNMRTSLKDVPGEIAYVCSKAALDKYVHDMSPHLGGTRVSMTMADPGWVRTDAGGPTALHAVESVLPGVLLGAVLDDRFNGCRFNAQEYAGLTLEAAVLRAQWHLKMQPSSWV